ncbi:timeless [Fistulifera solaris]|uniref:Timeless n=1 Tax=Fistulifera solaris TaxID=1519565 RepID=A0A1Z5J8C2_FISSO|nr:timeless [Fistulifera solaris]|eukprot:GAX10196.1 timeless [Fistulifera solaris]
MTVDKNVVEELLLVCGVLGTADEGQMVPVEDCLNWLQDLQRALRRDDDLYRPISLFLGDLKVVEQKLLPLVISCRYDTALVLTICKILVILTKPLAENTVRAGRMEINSSGKNKGTLFVQEQIKLRENALKQAETLMDYKRAVCYHPSHIKSNQSDEGGVLSIFVSLLAEPLAKQGTSRTENDHLTIELVLHLFRNLLQAEPLVLASADQAQESEQLHHEFINLIERELFLDIVHVLCADLEQRENAPYNLLLMELLHHLFRNQDPMAVAKACMGPAIPEQRRGQPGSLQAQLAREKQALAVTVSSRHSNFGGTLQLKGRHGEKGKYVSTSAGLFASTTSTAPIVNRRKSKKLDCFVGNSVTLQVHARSGCRLTIGPISKRAHRTLDDFCRRFLKECYGPVMKSLKNEFRRDSVRLEDNDRVVFFHIVWFFSQWWRSGGRKSITTNSSDSTKEVLGQLIFTLDIFTFNMVFNAIDTFHQHKKHRRMVSTVALLSEMMHLLHIMYQSEDSTEHLMAVGLMDRLFYNGDPLDRLPKLISKWAPGTNTREHLCDIVEISHITMKLLELSAKAARNQTVQDKKDTVNKLRAAAASFDVMAYFTRKIVSNQSVHMYTQLLSQYHVNSPQVNHRIVSFFLRLAQVKLAVPESLSPDETEGLPQNLLATKKVTLEPLLYNYHFLNVANTILNDKCVYKDKDFTPVLNFCVTTVGNFAKLASENPLLFVEALFRHPLPHKFCDHVTNMYVTEELRMLADRELLLERQEFFERQYSEALAKEDEEEDEPEFDDHTERGGSSGNPRGAGVNEEDRSGANGSNSTSNGNATRSSRKRVIDDDSDEEMEFEGKEVMLKSAKPNSTTSENDFEATDNVGSSPKRRTQKRSIDDSSDEELEFDGETTMIRKANANPTTSENELEATDNVDSPKRSIPRRSINDDSDEEMEFEEEQGTSTEVIAHSGTSGNERKVTDTLGSSPKRTTQKRLIHDDSDEEMEFQGDQVTLKEADLNTATSEKHNEAMRKVESSPKRKTRLIDDDDSDEEEENEKEMENTVKEAKYESATYENGRYPRNELEKERAAIKDYESHAFFEGELQSTTASANVPEQSTQQRSTNDELESEEEQSLTTEVKLDSVNFGNDFEPTNDDEEEAEQQASGAMHEAGDSRATSFENVLEAAQPSSTDDDRTAQIAFGGQVKESNVTAATSDHERDTTTTVASISEHIVQKRPIDAVNTSQVDELEKKKGRHILDDSDEES